MKAEKTKGKVQNRKIGTRNKTLAINVHILGKADRYNTLEKYDTKLMMK
jgi:hypothetical protein